MDLNDLFKTKKMYAIRNLPIPYAGWSIKSNQPEHLAYNNNGTSGSLFAPVIIALQGYVGAFKEMGSLYEPRGAEYVTQVDLNANSSIICRCSKQGLLQAAEYNRLSQKNSSVKYDELDCWGLAAIVANYIFRLADINKKNNIAAISDKALTWENLSELKSRYKDTGVLDETLVRVFCDDLRMSVTSGAMFSTIRSTQLDLLTTRYLDSKPYQAATLIFGEPNILVDLKTMTKVASAYTIGSCKQKALEYTKTLNWSPEEEALIPVFDDDTPVAPEVVTIMRRFLATKDSKTPFVNPCWRGITGYGKSTGVRMLACILHTPYTYIGCASATEKEEFFSKLIPNTATDSELQLVAKEDSEEAAKIFAEEANKNGMPTLQEMYFNPALAYKKITGKEDPSATTNRVLNAYCSKISVRKDPSSLFIVVESNFIKSLANGYICEVQEFSRIRDNGVLVALNGVNEAGANLPLVNGSVLKRKQNSLVVWTDNIGYSSCRPVDASVLRRMSYIIDSDKMDKSRVLERVKANTGFNDDALLEKLYQIWHSIAEYCKNNEIDSEGVVSIVELENLCKLVMLEAFDGISTYEELIHEAIVSKLSSDIETQREIMDTVAMELSKYKLD